MNLRATQLSASRGGRTIFSNLGFELNRGEGLIVTGPNGAGKSTLLRVIAGLLPASAGTLTLTPGSEATLQEQCHYLGHKNMLKEALSVAENLEFWQSFCGEPGDSIDAALDEVRLKGINTIPAGYLSAGQKRRVAIARLLVVRKPIWLIDEPTAALDADAETNFSRILQNHLHQGGIAIAATHQPLNLKAPKTLKMQPHRGPGDIAEEAFL